MSMRRLAEKASVLLAAALMFAQSVPAQVISGKQERAEDIPSTSQALSGRLFFSREQRERLDRARAGGGDVVEADVIDPPVSRINGFVKRSDGEMAVWVDGRAHYRVVDESVDRLQPQDVGGQPAKIHILASSGGVQVASKVRLHGANARISHKKKPALTP